MLPTGNLNNTMAKLYVLPFLALLSSLLVVALAAPAEPNYFVIQGRVYCDNCRAGFETNVTEYIKGAEVQLECRHYDNHTVAHTATGVTDSDGNYKLHMEDDHQEEICEVVLVSSPMEECNEVKVGRDRARVVLTRDNGIHTAIRYANSLGFLKAEPLSICGQLLQQYFLADEEY